MNTVNMLQAKSNLSRLVEAIEQGEEREIIIARNGRPAAKLIPIDKLEGQRIGARLSHKKLTCLSKETKDSGESVNFSILA